MNSSRKYSRNPQLQLVVPFRGGNGAGGGGGVTNNTIYADNIVSLPSGANEYITNIYWDPVAGGPVYEHSSSTPTGRLVSNPPSGGQVVESIDWDTTTNGPRFTLGAVIP